ADVDGKVILWNPDTGSSIRVLEGVAKPVRALAFSNDSRLLATGSDDFLVRLWDTPTGKLIGVLKGATHWIASLAFLPDGETLIASDGDQIRLWDVRARELKATHQAKDGVRAIAISPDGATLATAEISRTVCLWSTATGKQLASLEGHLEYVSALAFSPD